MVNKTSKELVGKGFWIKWVNSNCIGKHKLVQELIDKVGLNKMPISATELNAYFEDLARFIKNERPL
jgi:hypothetical protein